MSVHIVLKTYRATKDYVAYSVALKVFASHAKAHEFGEFYVDCVPGFDTEYDIHIITRDVE